MSAAEVSRIASQAAKWSVIAAMVAVPLAFASPDALYGYSQVPKVAALSVLAAIVATAWTIEVLAGRFGSGRFDLRDLYWSPAKWPLIFVGVFLLANLASAATSISAKGSVFGPYPGYDGYDLASTISLVVIGVATAFHLRSRTDFIHLLTAFVVAGAVAGTYGIFQAFGLDPFHFERFEVNSSRAALTFGNPLFAGSFLVMSLLATAALFALAQKVSSMMGFMAAVAFGVQAAAVAATVARGPWIAVAVGMVGLAVLLTLAGRKSAVARIPALCAVGAIAGLTVFVSADGAQTDQTAGRLESVSTASVSGLNGRLSLWQSGIDMALDRPWLDDSAGRTLLRHLFGYGPDMYRFAFPLVAPSEHAQQLVAHPHNTFLLAWNELGLIGLAAWTGLMLTLVVMGLLASLGRLGLSPWARILAAVFTVTAGAHFVNMQVSVPRAGDQVVMWASIGALIAVLASGQRMHDNGAPESPIRNKARLAMAASAAFAAIVVLVIASMSATRHLQADSAASEIQAALSGSSGPGELVTIADEASNIAPEVALYSLLEARTLSTAANALGLDPARQLSTRIEAIAALEQAVDTNPVGHAERLQLARLNYTMVTSGAADRLDETLNLYEDLVLRLPNFWPAWMEMAATYALADRPVDGREALERAEYLFSLPEAYRRDDAASRQNLDAVAAALEASEVRLNAN